MGDPLDELRKRAVEHRKTATDYAKQKGDESRRRWQELARAHLDGWVKDLENAMRSPNQRYLQITAGEAKENRHVARHVPWETIPLYGETELAIYAEELECVLGKPFRVEGKHIWWNDQEGGTIYLRIDW